MRPLGFVYCSTNASTAASATASKGNGTCPYSSSRQREMKVLRIS
jgi:hypothetical protein